MKKPLALLCVLAFVPLLALADDDDDRSPRGERGREHGREHGGKSLAAMQVNAVWQKECGSCHLAFDPGLLPADTWRRMMTGLDRHFGADATLTAPEAREITDFLVQHAATGSGGAGAPLRITETAWFKRKHSGREVPAGVFKRAAVKSPANCLACHPGAEKFDFNEHGVKIPA
jgi:hypothetical protein